MASPVYDETAELLAAYSRKIYEQGLTPATSGNLSLKQEDRIYVTPTGTSLGEITASDIVQINLQGDRLSGERAPSSEWIMHRELYLARPGIGAVIHAHPAKATALAVCHKAIEQPLLAEAVVFLGEIPLIPYLLPGSKELARAAAERINNSQALLLANHGVIAVGKSIAQAFYNLELLESLAEIYIITQSLPGGPKPLHSSEVGELLKLKASHCAD